MERSPITFYNALEKEIAERMYCLDWNVTQGNAQLQKQLADVEKSVMLTGKKLSAQIDKQSRERIKVVEKHLLCSKDNEVYVVKTMSDGSQQFKKFITKPVGPWEVCDLYVDVIKPYADYFIIAFKMGQIQIAGNKGRVNGKWLYEEFVRNGIEFNPELRKVDIENTLFEEFAQIINAPSRQVVISSKAGWDGAMFRDFYTYPFRTPDHAALPVYQRCFYRKKADRQDYLQYFGTMNQIRKWENRLLIMIPLYIGIVKSLLQSAGMKNSFCWNFVMMGGVSEPRLASWLQIYNRGNWKILDSDVSTKKIKNLFVECKDEVLLMDFRSVPTESPYKIRKKTDLFWTIFRELQREPMPFLLASVNETFVLGKKIFNVYVDTDFCNDRGELPYMTDSLTAVMASFVGYVENNFYDTMSGFQGMAQEDYGELKAVWELLCRFFASQGYDIVSELGIPEGFAWEHFVEVAEWDDDELDDLFVKEFRKAVGSYSFEQKTYGRELNVKDTIIFNDEFIFVPVGIWIHLLVVCRLEKYQKQILIHLKDQGMIKTDPDGFSRKIRCGNQAHECYQIAKSYFNITGYSDITSCGKEG